MQHGRDGDGDGMSHNGSRMPAACFGGDFGGSPEMIDILWVGLTTTACDFRRSEPKRFLDALCRNSENKY